MEHTLDPGKEAGWSSGPLSETAVLGGLRKLKGWPAC